MNPQPTHCTGCGAPGEGIAADCVAKTLRSIAGHQLSALHAIDCLAETPSSVLHTSQRERDAFHGRLRELRKLTLDALARAETDRRDFERMFGRPDVTHRAGKPPTKATPADNFEHLTAVVLDLKLAVHALQRVRSAAPPEGDNFSRDIQLHAARWHFNVTNLLVATERKLQQVNRDPAAPITNAIEGTNR